MLWLGSNWGLQINLFRCRICPEVEWLSGEVQGSNEHAMKWEGFIAGLGHLHNDGPSSLPDAVSIEVKSNGTRAD